LSTRRRPYAGEVPILTRDQITSVIDALRGTKIFPHVMILVSSGIRRGELMALRWSDIDFGANTVRVQRSVEATKSHGLRIKPPKTRHGRRTITLPAVAISTLKEHRLAEHEIRLALGLGKVQPTDFVFGNYDGKPRHPDWLTYHWKHMVEQFGLPRVTLHAFRHSHASALIAGGQDVVTVSRRLGHASPTITLSVYAHLFAPTDQAAADAIESLLKPKANKS
jgi:integrase